jgi:hypothetical protein
MSDSNENLEETLQSYHISPPNPVLRKSILNAARAEWNATSSMELKERILTAAKSEWKPKKNLAFKTSPFFWVAASLFIGFGVITTANFTSNNILSKWQPVAEPTVPNPNINNEYKDISRIQTILASVDRPQSLDKMMLAHIGRTEQIINQVNGEKL